MFLHFESVELLLQMGADPHTCQLGASYVFTRKLRPLFLAPLTLI